MANLTPAKLAERARAEISAAADALLRTNALLVVIKKAVDESNLDGLCAHSLIETALELTGVYAERADAEADFFAEVH
ncbi:MAG: hypothetical protein EPN70_17520 [Paraburkholderia sp.]|uniref:hypothetical protein n=1 Tax=Paraburkholderia sp. TaxID=1926495 RepID=UPI00120D43D9|nr:hypothetical protein [Paraburkholderia sp.]TAM02180.1 MAG: hypothetical protein EPN70_17520 [Paraburkholderia sp.]TAM28132.1 MAG: hypothetical protein EPN59_18400 [Paraburkholderia sp.]